MTVQPPPSTLPWKALLDESITTAEHLARHIDVDPKQLAPVIRSFPLRINPYYLSLLRQPGDPLWRQAAPDPAELTDTVGTADPLCEEQRSPVSVKARGPTLSQPPAHHR